MYVCMYVLTFKNWTTRIIFALFEDLLEKVLREKNLPYTYITINFRGSNISCLYKTTFFSQKILFEHHSFNETLGKLWLRPVEIKSKVNLNNNWQFSGTWTETQQENDGKDMIGNNDR